MELMPGYKQTEVGVIPEDWDTAIVGQAFVICNQLRLPLSRSDRNLIPGPYPYYGPTGVQGWINEYRVEGKYALIGEDGDHFLKWQAQPMTKLVEGRFNVNNHAHLVKGSRNLTEWFYWYFSNRDITAHLTRQGAGRFKLTKVALTKIPCALPPPGEQLAISKALSEVDALLSSLEQLLCKKRQIKQAAMQELLTGKRRLPGFEGEWEEASIGGMVDLLTGFPFASSGYSSSGIRLLRGSNVKRGLIDWNEDLAQHWPAITSDIARYALRQGDIVIAMDGALVGRSYARIQASDLPALLLQRVARIRSSSLCNDFLFFQIGSSRFADHCDSVKTSTAIPHISPGDIRNFKTLIPPTKNEQIAIAAILLDLDAEISGLETRLNKARELKQGMMQQLLTGKIRLI